MKTATSSNSQTARRLLRELFGRKPLRNVGFRLWDGTAWPDESPRAATVVLNHPAALRRMLGPGTEKALAEAYLYDDFEIVGDIEAAFEIGDALAERRSWTRSFFLARLLRKLPAVTPDRADGSTARFTSKLGRHSPERDRAAIAFHYDVSNDFYQLWLDQQMVYSCAYFAAPDFSLDEAQIAKLDYLCRKLRLKAGQRLLDVGCGWGGLALHAARHYGARVTGVTLSKEQAQFAAARIAAAGLSDRARIECRDYRALHGEPPFDAAVSVGMSEHVGRKMLPVYFKAVWDLLKPGGVFLNHAIAEGARYRPALGPSFIESYVFPDSDLPPIETVLASAATAGFEVRDVENLREHYARTLRHWVRRLESRHAEALAFIAEPAFRVWRLYMAGCARGFDQGRLAIYQTLLSKLDQDGHAHLPATRSGWYQAEPNRLAD